MHREPDPTGAEPEEPVTAEIEEPGTAPTGPEADEERVPEHAASSRVRRVETAVSPVIQGDSVSIPTPAWGVALPEDVETVEAELVETGEAAALDAGDEDGEDESMPGPEWTPLMRQWPGWLALVFALGTAVVTGVAVAVDAAKGSEAATVLAWVAIGCSVAAFLGGVLAAVFNRGRVSGVAAAIIGLFANPWVLLQVLTLLKG